MAATTTTTLQSVSPRAETALFGWPTKAFMQTATATALDCTLTPNTAAQVAAGGQAMCAVLYHITLSYSAAPAVSTLTVEDGTTVLWQAEISATGPFVYTFDFQQRPLRGSAGAVLHVKVGSAGGAVVQTISCLGDIINAN